MYSKVNELVRQIKQGDRSAVGELLGYMRPLILKSVRAHFSGGRMKEDMVQQGYLIAIESIRTFDEHKYKSYPRYLKIALYYGLFQRNKLEEVLCLNIETGDGLEAVDMIEDAQTDVEEESIRDIEYFNLRKAVKMLSGKQRYIITERFFKNRELKDIADDMGISYTCTIKHQNKAIANLRELLTGGVNEISI